MSPSAPPAQAFKPIKTERHTAVAITEFLPPEFSEVALAKHWSASCGQDWAYTSAWNQWAQWTGTRWEIDKRNRVTSITCDEMTLAANWPPSQNLTVGQKRAICSRKNISSVLALAGSFPDHACVPEDWDTDIWLLGTPNGVVDLKTGELRPPNRDDRITKQTAVAPKYGRMPRWDAVLDRCTMGDEEMRLYYQKWAGYTLTGSCKEEAFLFIHGSQQSGKSKFIACIAEILGEYRAEASIETFMESRIARHPEEIAAMKGARMITCTEPTAGMRWNEGLVKKITGREKMTASRKYEHQFEFEMQGKIWISGNDKPQITSADGMERRLHVAEFPESLKDSEKIENLPELLQAEWPQILQWAIDGCLLWQREGLVKPQQVKSAVAEYISAQDVIGEWLAECTAEDNEKFRIKTSDLYTSYAEWAKLHGIGILGNTRFGPEMTKRGFKQVKSNGVRYYAGVRLRSKLENESIF